MRTNLQTTYILLERGTEDRQLRDELLKVAVKVVKDFKSGTEYLKAFPMIADLLEGLNHEISEQEVFDE